MCDGSEGDGGVNDDFCGRWVLWWSEVMKKEEDGLVLAHGDEGLVVVGLYYNVEET